MNYSAYCDGACSREGVGEGSFAVYKWYPDPELIVHEKRFSVAPPWPMAMTNNIAEARTLQTAIVWMLKNGVLRPGNFARLRMDSQTVICQLTGVYQTKAAHLRVIYQEIYEILKQGKVTPEMLQITWISGDEMKGSVIGH